MLGLPGAGKGTQGELLAQRLGIPRISTGDMFREALRSETALGRQVKEYVERGELVPDHLTVALVEERLKQPDARAGFVLDCFPRTVPQARGLEETLAAAGRPLRAAGPWCSGPTIRRKRPGTACRCTWPRPIR